MVRKKKEISTEINKRERAILKYIERQINTRGYPPSVREIGKSVGLSSTATVHSYLIKLEEKGYFKNENKKEKERVFYKRKTWRYGEIFAKIAGNWLRMIN